MKTNSSRLLSISCAKGFLMMEVLLAILILSIAFVSFAAVIGQVLKVTSKSQDLTLALLKYEEALFELENGQRNDVVHYGGQGAAGEDYGYAFQSDAVSGNYFTLKGKLLWKKGNDFLEVDLIFPGVPVQ